jgi:tartrate dehydrogenase/decarboxylase / D-malate dehydrogenase
MSTHRIAVIAGDGIGNEVMPQGLAVLDAAARRFNIKLQIDEFDFANCAYFAKHGNMLPSNWKEQIGGHHAILFGAVGWPATVPDHISLWGSLLKFRREFDQYINLRPARLMPGIRSPLVNRAGEALKPGEIDMWIVRENTEGEYSSVGGRMYEGTEREIVIQETVMSRVGVDRVLKFAFELAASRPRQKLTSATKSNGIAITMPYWDERVQAMAKGYPQVAVDQFHIDILTAHFVQRPQHFDVVVASNLFGDILSDLGPACTGTIGIAPSANLNPTKQWPSLFEPVHGSAPDIAGKGIANPIGQVWSVAMLLDFLGHRDAHDAVLRAIEGVLADTSAPRTPDLGGRANTEDLGCALAQAVAVA